MDQERIEIIDYYIYTDRCYPLHGTCIRFRTEYHGSRFNKYYLRQIAVVYISEGVETVLKVHANRRLKQMDRHSKFFGGEMKRLSMPNDDDLKEIEAAAENWAAGNYGGLKVIKDKAGNLLGFRLPFGGKVPAEIPSASAGRPGTAGNPQRAAAGYPHYSQSSD